MEEGLVAAIPVEEEVAAVAVAAGERTAGEACTRCSP